MAIVGEKSLKGRVNFLDGLRGWAALVVLIAHLNAFLLDPAIYSKGAIFDSFTDGNYLASALAFILNVTPDGSLAVQIFFVLSGYALSVSYLKPGREGLALAVVSRYFRLMMPIFIVAIITYLVAAAGLFFNIEAVSIKERYSGWIYAFYTNPISFINAIKFSLYDVFFKGVSEKTLNPPLWTMRVELIGSFVIYAYLFFFRSGSRVHWPVAALLALFFAWNQSFYLCFISGYLIAEVNKRFPLDIVASKIRSVEAISLLLLCFVVVFSYFVKGAPYNNYGSLIAIGVVLFVSYSKVASGLLSNSVSRFLGTISFPLYLIHVPVIFSMSCLMFVGFYKSGIDQIASIYLNIILTVVFCLVISSLLVPVERRTMRWSKNIGRFILGRLHSLRSLY
ncbi:acyltransferase family protein [Pseudomonas protegens]|uniref:acyltransferase family protein n=1 Tax=Pseudomonas protegens TaxID=380021 RepID=UPI00224061B0|nr:acyltransferase [Pseudomonas protegens]